MKQLCFCVFDFIRLLYVSLLIWTFI